jgi:transcriptional regulator with XRE-family HTH domain
MFYVLLWGIIMTSIRKILAVNIKAYRKELNLSQTELAEKANVSLHHLAMAETEKTWLSSTMLEKLALALGKESFEMFAVDSTQADWQRQLLNDMDEFIKLKREQIDCHPKD